MIKYLIIISFFIVVAACYGNDAVEVATFRQNKLLPLKFVDITTDKFDNYIDTITRNCFRMKGAALSANFYLKINKILPQPDKRFQLIPGRDVNGLAFFIYLTKDQVQVNKDYDTINSLCGQNIHCQGNKITIEVNVLTEKGSIIRYILFGTLSEGEIIFYRLDIMKLYNEGKFVYGFFGLIDCDRPRWTSLV